MIWQTKMTCAAIRCRTIRWKLSLSQIDESKFTEIHCYTLIWRISVPKESLTSKKKITNPGLLRIFTFFNCRVDRFKQIEFIFSCTNKSIVICAAVTDIIVHVIGYRKIGWNQQISQCRSIQMIFQRLGPDNAHSKTFETKNSIYVGRENEEYTLLDKFNPKIKDNTIFSVSHGLFIYQFEYKC